jgi:hypothetical protein
MEHDEEVGTVMCEQGGRVATLYSLYKYINRVRKVVSVRSSRNYLHSECVSMSSLILADGLYRG